jgi:hypothetical protein
MPSGVSIESHVWVRLAWQLLPLGLTSYFMVSLMEAAVPTKIQVSEIDSMLNSLARKDPGWDGRLWTQMIKERLIELAETYGCQAYASQCNNQNRAEWLYDVVWLQESRGLGHGVITDSPFVAEIEWSNEKAVIDDFQKLLLARADTRLMVFEAASAKQAEQRMGRLIQQVRAYSRTESGDRYIFACLDNRRSEDEPYNFSCHEYVHPGQRR